MCRFGVEKQYTNRRQRCGGYRHRRGFKTRKPSETTRNREKPGSEVVLPFGGHVVPPPQSRPSSPPGSSQAVLTQTHLTESLPPYHVSTFPDACLRTRPLHTLHPPARENHGTDCPGSTAPTPACGSQAWPPAEPAYTDPSTALGLEGFVPRPSRGSEWPPASPLSPASDLRSSEFGARSPLSVLHCDWLL